MGDDEAGAVLGGGGDSGTVVRVGDTVRRRVRPWSASVHALLRHLEAVGFDGAPRVLGIDESGREVLSYAARTFVPLYAEQDCVAMGYEVSERAQRLRLFCDAYGMSDRDRGMLLPLVHRRLASENSPFAQRCRETLQQDRRSWNRALD